MLNLVLIHVDDVTWEVSLKRWYLVLIAFLGSNVIFGSELDLSKLAEFAEYYQEWRVAQGLDDTLQPGPAILLDINERSGTQYVLSEMKKAWMAKNLAFRVPENHELLAAFLDLYLAKYHNSKKSYLLPTDQIARIAQKAVNKMSLPNQEPEDIDYSNVVAVEQKLINKSIMSGVGTKKVKLSYEDILDLNLEIKVGLVCAPDPFESEELFGSILGVNSANLVELENYILDFYQKVGPFYSDKYGWGVMSYQDVLDDELEFKQAWFRHQLDAFQEYLSIHLSSPILATSGTPSRRPLGYGGQAEMPGLINFH